MDDSYTELLSVAEKKAEEQRLAMLKRKRLANGGQSRGPDPAAVAAFKARKEREQRERLLREKQAKQKLLALRAENSKSDRTAQMMRSRTKDNDFSKINQTEQDRHIDAKVREKGIKDTRERMKARLEMEQELAGLNRKQKELLMSRTEREKPLKLAPAGPKIQDIIKQSMSGSATRKPVRAPPPSYDEVLALAGQKSLKKISLEEELQLAQSERSQRTDPPHRALTQKEKDRHRDRDELRSRPKPVPTKPDNLRSEGPKRPAAVPGKAPAPPAKKSTMAGPPLKNSAASRPTSSARLRDAPLPGPSSNGKPQQYSRKELPAPPLRPSVPAARSIAREPGKQPALDRSRPPPPPPRPKLPPIGAMYRRGMYHSVEDHRHTGPADEDDDSYCSDEEEDDEMADFIDDGPIHEPEEEEYSRHIREIFGYDKRKYRHVIDDDVEVADYRQVMKEEARSLREGVREDLEDIERERKEKMLKKAKLKRLKGC